MKKVGEILFEKRKKMGISLEEVERETKIRKNFLEAIEKNQFSMISDTATLQGFLRNYAQFLGISPQEIMAIFRRDFQEDKKGQIVPRAIVSPLPKNDFSWTPKMTIYSFIVLFLLIFGLVFQRIYLRLSGEPSLRVFSPRDGEIYEKNVPVEGEVDPQATLKIDGNPAIIDEKGKFKEEIVLPRGENIVLIEAISRNGKKQIKTIKVFVK